MRWDKENAEHNPRSGPAAPRRRFGPKSRTLGRSSRCWVIYLTAALLPIRAWGQQGDFDAHVLRLLDGARVENICDDVGIGATGGPPEPEIPLEQAVKAAYVYNFVQLVTWPESPLTRTAAFSLCVLPDGVLAEALQATVRHKRVMGRPLTVGRFSSIDDVVPCSVLFVGRGMAGWLPQIHQRLRGWAVLTVSDVEGFTAQGGMIGLFLEDNRVRFEVELAATQAAGLQISSKLLRLARPSSGRPCLSCAAGSGGGR